MTSDTMNAYTERSKYIAMVFFGGSLVAVLGWFELGDPFIMDETEFASAIRAILRTGEPSFYATELSGEKSGLWHPPTYVYYVAAWSTVLGHSWFIVRLATLSMTIITIPIVSFLAYTLADITLDTPTDNFAVVSVSIIIFALSPLIIQNGVLVDINGSILAFVSTLYVTWTVWAVSSESTSRLKRYMGIVGLVFLISWVKFGVLPVLLVTTVIFVTSIDGFQEGFIGGVSFLTGFSLFTISWFAVTSVSGLSFMDPFIHNFGMLYGSAAETSTNYSLIHRILKSGWVLYNELLWLSPFMVILAIFSLRTTMPSIRSPRVVLCKLAASPRIFVAMVAFSLLFQYSVLAKMPYGFPKYLGTATPLLVTLAAFPVATLITEKSEAFRGQVIAAIGLITSGVALTVFLLPDPFRVPFEQGVMAATQQAILTIFTVLLITALVGAFVVRVVNRSPSVTLARRDLIVLCLIILLVGSNIGLLATQATADVSTRYYYGQPAMEESIGEIRSEYNNLNTSERRYAALPMDIGYYVDGPHSDIDEVHTLQENGIDPPLIVVRTQKYYNTNTPLVRELRNSEEYQSYRSGWFIIFTRLEG